MSLLLHPGECFSFFHPSVSFFRIAQNEATAVRTEFFLNTLKCPVSKTHYLNSRSCKNALWYTKIPVLRTSHAVFCTKKEGLRKPRFSEMPDNQEAEGLELLGKPSPMVLNNEPVEELDEEETKVTDKNEVLENFYKFFKPRESLQVENDDSLESRSVEDSEKVSIEYYEPKPGDLVVGVVVSGNENKLDVNVGSDLIGTMLTKEVLPLYDKEINYMMCDVENGAKEFMVNGKIGIIKNDEAVSGEPMPGRPVVEPGTFLFAEVLGRTLSGRPLLSTRRLFRRVAWHRVRQIKQLNEPIMVKVTEWNTGGLVTRIEGLRAFLPKIELMNRVNKYADLKNSVGRWMCVLITRINEDTNELILSEKEAWQMRNLQEGSLLEGTVKKIYPFGAQIRIGETNRSGLLHISNITQGRVASVSDLLAVDEKVKVLVVKSMIPDKISVSTAELESEPGLILSNKEKVFAEAEEMAKRYRQKMPVISVTGKFEPLPSNLLHFEDEQNSFANWKWFKFQSRR